MKVMDLFMAQPQVEGLRFACSEHTAEFRGLQDEWLSLHAACADATPFTSWEWLFSWWQAYGGDKRLRLFTWRLDGALAAVVPLYLACEKTAAGVSSRVLRMVGDGTHDSDYLGFSIRSDVAPMVLQQLGGWLALNREWDVLALSELHETSALRNGLRELARRHGFKLHIAYGRCAAAALPRTFDEFLAMRQPRFRTKVRSLMRRLDESGCAFESTCTAAQLRQKLRSLFALHQGRWQAGGATGVFGSRAKRMFYAHFVPRFARRGWLRLYSLRGRHDYVAHQLCFGGGGTTYLLQEGFDVADPSASYGQMLRGAVMRHLIERAERSYDFLGGFSKHKQDWGATEGRTIRAVLARPTWRAWLYVNLPLWRERAAMTARRILPEVVVRGIQRVVVRSHGN